jgi:hypothetical protein
MQVNWNGTYFDNQPFVASQFFQDANGSLYFFEQNYRNFFPVTNPSSGVPQLSQGDLAKNLASGTLLTSVDSLLSNVTTIATSVIQYKRGDFRSNSKNILDSVTQEPTSLVNTAIQNALSSNQGLQTALQSAAGYLTHPDLNFALGDIQGGWHNGPQLIQILASLINNHQANILGASDALKRISDFKKKILLQVTNAADEARKLQGQLDIFQSENTLQALSTTFPTVFGPIKQLLDNQNKALSGEIARLLPGSLASRVNVGSFLSNIFNSVVGSKIPQILNPIDKIFSDVEYISSEGDNLINQIPVDGFGNLETQTAVVNQVANILNNFVNNIAIKPTIPTFEPVTGLANIYETADQYVQQQLGILTSQLATSEQSIIDTISKNGISPVPPPLDPNDSFNGGTLANVFSSANLPTFPSVAPLNYPTPDVTISGDPQIAVNQSNRNAQQVSANEPGVTRTVKRGDCINNISDVPLKPRSQPVDGSQGDYQGAKSIPI